MDANSKQDHFTPANPSDELAPEIAQWLCVSGDIDDFIYYGQEPQTSER